MSRASRNGDIAGMVVRGAGAGLAGRAGSVVSDSAAAVSASIRLDSVSSCWMVA
jgi:hypothetical protein